MSLFEKIFKGTKREDTAGQYYKTLTAYAPVFTTRQGSLYESELVRAAIDARARHISKLKVEIRSGKGANLTLGAGYAPNEFQTWGQFLYRVSTILDMQNTAFIVPIENEFAEITGYYPILPSRCVIKEGLDGTEWLVYEFSSGDSAAVEFKRCGVLTKFQYRDDFFGESNSALSPTLDLIDIQNQGITEGVKSSASFRFMAKLTNFSDPKDLAEEQKRFTRENLQADAGSMLLFPNTYGDIKQIQSSPFVIDSAQRNAIETNVKNYFGVNDDILQNKVTGDMWNAFYEGAVEAFAIQFSDVMTKMTFSEKEQADGALIMATANRLQYMSNSDKLEYAAQMADRGIMNRDEIREMLQLPPLPNGEGQAYTIRGEYYFVGKKGKGDKSNDRKTEKKA